MYKEALRPSWMEIDFENLEKNVNAVADLIGGKDRIVGVLKADGYGHGTVQCGLELQRLGVTNCCVATLDEAVRLREAGFTANILMMSLTPDFYISTLLDYDLMALVDDLDNAQAISDAAVQAGKIISCDIAVDTGMGRIGLCYDDPQVLESIRAIAALPGLKVRGLFSHMSCSEEQDTSFCDVQLQRYQELIQQVDSLGLDLDFNTLVNSASTMLMPQAYYHRCRIGYLLWGLYPSDFVDPSSLPLHPVMSIKAAIVKIKTVPAGTPISYSRRFITQRESRIGTLCIGTADGYPATAINKMHVLAGGGKAPIVGTICMDHCMIDLTDLPQVQVGDEVVLLGSQEDLSITMGDIANAGGITTDELLCDWALRLPRVYKRGETVVAVER